MVPAAPNRGNGLQGLVQCVHRPGLPRPRNRASLRLRQLPERLQLCSPGENLLAGSLAASQDLRKNPALQALE
jgi:hypothetical protein